MGYVNMTLVSPNRSSNGGVISYLNNITAADIYSVPNPGGNTELHITGGTRDVTLYVWTQQQVDGRYVDPLRVVCDDNVDRLVGTFPRDIYTNSDGDLQFVVRKADDVDLLNMAPRAIATSALTAGGSTSTLRLASGFEMNVQADDLLQVGAEELRITSVTSQTNLTVFRGARSSPQSAHAIGDLVYFKEASRTRAQAGTIQNNMNNSTTTLTLAADTGLTIAVNDYLRIENEIVQVDAVASQTSFTIDRGEQGTTNAGHTAGDPVWLVETGMKMYAVQR